MHTIVLQSVAARALPELERISTEYTREVRKLPGYSAAAVTDEELYNTASTTLNLLMRLLSGQPVGEQLGVVSDGIGRRRARQGLALDSLLRAVRMDFRFLWGVLRAEASADESVQLADEVATIWDAVELHTSRLQSAYIDELAFMNRELEQERATLLRRLLVDGVADATQLSHVAAAFGLSLQGTFRVAVASPQHRSLFRQRAAALRPRVNVHDVNGQDLIIIDLEATRYDEAVLATLPAGVSPEVTGMAELAGAWQLARRLATHVLEPDLAATLATHWPHLALEAMGDLRSRLLTERTRALDALAPERAAPLLEAVRVFMSSGSVNQSAGRLFLHRNTMLKRLQRFTHLTGLDPSVPDDAALIALLLAAREQRSPDAHAE